MRGLFISLEGAEGSGKTTQIRLLESRLLSLGLKVLSLREPGGTPIGEEIRHTLKHSEANQRMFPETELLLMSASRAQLVREVIQPSLARGEVVICDRFYDSTMAYQGYGRGLDMKLVDSMIQFAVGETKPCITFFLRVPAAESEARKASRNAAMAEGQQRDRFEEEERAFFDRVEKGFEAIAAGNPERIRIIDGTEPVERVSEEIWRWVDALVNEQDRLGTTAYKSIGEWRGIAPG
ncbi:MAG: dTMP kinase [Verrucomicrobiales bacterium]